MNGGLLTYEVVSNHGNDTDLFEYSDESDGQLIVHGDIADFLNIEGSQTCTAAHKNRL